MHTTERLKGITAALSKAGLAEGTNPNTIKTAAPNGAGTDFAVDGYAYHLADTDNIAMTALAQQAAGTTCLYGVWVNSAGNVLMNKGTEVLTSRLSATSGESALPLPAEVDGRALLGYIKVATVAVTFTSGSTDLSAAGVTATYYDVVGGPVRPRTS